MDSKLIAMVLGVALVLATATVYTQSAFGSNLGSTGGSGNGNGVIDGQQAHGLANACSHSHAADHNKNCGQTSPGGLRVKPVLAPNINHNN
jgi:hypothetical protein